MKPFYETRSQTLFVGPMCSIPFPLHVHAVVEIICLLEGQARISVSGIPYDLTPGDILVIFPSVAHSYDQISEVARGLCTIFVPETIAEFSNVFRSLRPITPLLPADKCSADLQSAAQKLLTLSSIPNSPFLRGYLHVYLAHLLNELPLESLDKHVDNTLTQRVIQFLAEHYTEPLSLDTVSHDLGVSRSHLSHLFSEQLNINFRKYINILRVDEARSLLRDTDMTVIEVCYAVGYNNPRTFYRAFQDECGIQPSEFRANYRG